MNDEVKAELQRQQDVLLQKLSSVMDSKVGQMKRELEKVSNKAHDSQMHELKRMKFSETPSFRKKVHAQQYKHHEQVKLCILEATDAAKDKEIDTCIQKLDEGRELIETRQKLVLADKSEYGWKTVSEYLDNELKRQKKRRSGSLPRQGTRRNFAQVAEVVCRGFVVVAHGFSRWQRRRHHGRSHRLL